MVDQDSEICVEESPYPADLIEPEPVPIQEGPLPALHIRFWISLKRGVVRKLLHVWAITLFLSIFVIYALEGILPEPSEPIMTWWSSDFFIIVATSFTAAYFNSALGMGYGVTMIPILLLMNYDLVMVLPAVLTAQFLSEIGAGVSHSEAGNINFTKDSPHFRVTMVLAGCGIVGAILAVRLFVAVNSFSKDLAVIIVGILVGLVGIVILATMGRRFRFSWRKIIFLGLIASLIKGFTGGGYGPIVTGGQVLCGVGGKQAIGIKSVAEGLTCLVAVMMFLASGNVHDMTIGYPLVLGAVCSLPFSAYTVRQIGTKRVTTLIGFITIVLGILTVLKVTYL